MAFVLDTLWACLVLGLPVAALTLGLVWWAVQQGSLTAGQDLKEMRRGIKAMANMHKGKGAKKGEAGAAPKRKPNVLHAKWFKMGGGFYGVVALYTYLRVEAGEVVDFLKGLGDLVFRLELNILINFLIESITNFITAVTWPLYWMREAGSGAFWMWFLVAYAGYGIGMHLARRVGGRSSGIFTRSSLDDDDE